MATFRGMVKGNRKAATRNGSKKSGINVTAQSWGGSVQIRMYEKNGEIMCEITAGEGSQPYPKGTIIYNGSLNNLLRSDKDVESI